MNSPPESSQFAMQLLLQEEPISETQYKEYRMNLESALTTAQRRETLTGRIAGIALVVSFVLMFVGGSGIFGAFDPWSKDATGLSIVLGVAYAIAAVAWPLAMAAYFSRFRPRVREIKEQLRDAALLAVQSELVELRKQVAAISKRDDAG